MPGQEPKKNVPLAKKFGAKVTAAHKAHKDKPVESGNASLPPNIENGVAKVAEAKIALYKTGDLKDQPYFTMRAVVRTPITHDGIPCRGRQTKVGPIPLCDTPSRVKKTFAEHYGDMLNHLKLLGVDTAATEGDMTPEQVDEFLAEAMTALCDPQNPTFTLFRTWKGDPQEVVKRGEKWFVVQGKNTKGGPYATEEEAKKKNPFAGKPSNVTEEWVGRCDPPADDEAPMDDETAGPGTEAAGEGGDETPPPDAPAGEAGPIEDPEEILIALVTQASVPNAQKIPDGRAAIKQLIEMAAAAGVDKAVVDAANSWAEVADLIRATQAPAADSAEDAPGDETPPDDETPPADEEAPPDEEPTEPVKGSVVKWCWTKKDGTPMNDPKTKKPLSPTDHEVLTVNQKNQTVTLKNLTTEKPVNGGDKKPHHVPWAQLS